LYVACFTCLDVPLAQAQLVESETLRHLLHLHAPNAQQHTEETRFSIIHNTTMDYSNCSWFACVCIDSDLHGVGQILLVCEHEQSGLAQLILCQHAVKLLLGRMFVVLGVIDTIAIVRINHEDDTLDKRKQ